MCERIPWMLVILVLQYLQTKYRVTCCRRICTSNLMGVAKRLPHWHFGTLGLGGGCLNFMWSSDEKFPIPWWPQTLQYQACGSELYYRLSQHNWFSTYHIITRHLVDLVSRFCVFDTVRAYVCLVTEQAHAVNDLFDFWLNIVDRIFLRTYCFVS